MHKFSYSQVSTFEQCPYKYHLRYRDRLKTLPADDADNPLLLGIALHRGIETDVETAIHEYFMSFPIITDAHINEEIKLRHMIPKVAALLPEGEHELSIGADGFTGVIDLIANGTLYDFKYINPKNKARYADSQQLHLYKHYAPTEVKRMAYVFVPKVAIRQKKTETLTEFRTRLQSMLDRSEPLIEFVEYDPDKVIKFLETTQEILQCEEFPKNQTRLCDWCEYQKYCEEGDNTEMLPSTNRVPVNAAEHKRMWIYGAPFSGKTTLCDGAPVPLNLNTDGNVKTVTMARLPVKDTMEGRQKRLAWEVFKEAIDDLERGSDFKTIVVDLLDDTYESCRLYMYKQMGITHESDDSFRAWDKVRTEFLSTYRRLLNLPYNIVLLSHEDLSKDITKRTGDKVTAIKPNIPDKVANKLAGMVDIVARVMVEDDGRYLSFKTDAVTFGGGRITTNVDRIPLKWDAIEEFYKED